MKTCLYMNKLLFLILAVILIAGCKTKSTYENSYKALSISKETAIFIAHTAKSLQTAGIIDDVKLGKVRETYEQVQKAQALLIESQVEALDHTDENTEQQIAALTSVYLKTMTNFINLAIEIGILNSGDKRITSAPVTPGIIIEKEGG